MKIKLVVLALLVVVFNSFPAQENSKKVTDDLKMKIGGDIQFHARQFLSNESADENGDFFLRRSRLKLSGNYTDYFSFRILANFANSKLNLQDSYFEFMPSSYLQFRFGKFKAPIGLELLQSPANLAFIERSLVTNLVPNRDLGIMVFGKIGCTVEYQAGIINGVVDGRNGEEENDKNKEFAARIILAPFASTEVKFLNKLHLGMSFSGSSRSGSEDNPLLAVYKSTGRNKFFSYADGTNSNLYVAYADGSKKRYVPQFYLYEGRFGLLGEYATTTEEVTAISYTGVTRHAEFTNTSFQVTAIFMLTNDQPSSGRVIPSSEFDPANGKWGAVEIAARYVTLNVDDEVFPVFASKKYSAESAECYGVGVNWYLNKYFRLSLNFEKTTFDSGFTGINIDDEDVLLMQTQVTF